MHKSIFFLVFFFSHTCNSEESHSEIPCLLVDDGNLTFYAASDKHIRFLVSDSSKVSINDVDLVTSLNKANDLIKLLDNYKETLFTVAERVNSVNNRIILVEKQGNNSGSTYRNQSMYVLETTKNRVSEKFNSLRKYLLEDDCLENPCKNGGTCEDLYRKYVCHCDTGWQGANCTEDVDECSQYVGTDLGCQNGATCVNKPGSYDCICPLGYVGIHCMRRKADCYTGGRELCGQGTCVQHNTQTGYRCICEQGWTTDGTNPACSVDVDECNLNNTMCSKNPLVSCVNRRGSFQCGPCPAGYSGDGFYCADIDECDSNNGGCSLHPRVLCINTRGSRICDHCPAGYKGDGVTCIFQGACNINNGGCDKLAQCRIDPSISATHVECICPAGYIANDIGPNGCVPRLVDPCAFNPCINGHCFVNNITADYDCVCNKSYTGRNCDVFKQPCNPNPCLNGGTCYNPSGILFKCVCLTGFKGQRCETQKLGCGEPLTGEFGVLKHTFSNYSFFPSCSWTIRTKPTKILNITFTKFEVSSTTNCKFDWLEMHDGPSSAAPVLGRFCGTNLPQGGKILSTHNVIYLWLLSSGNTTNEFELTWNATDPVCGGVFNVTSHGSIGSPGSPYNYPLNRNCSWSLHAPFSKRFLLHFFSLNIGNDGNCDRDYLEISTLINARDNYLLAKICNGSAPAPIHSPSADVALYFHSDSKDSYPGFQMSYTVIEGIPGCGGIYSNDRGIVRSLQPDDSQNLLCDYKIQFKQNYRTKISFLSFDLQDSPGCTNEYVEIREGATTDSPLVQRYCGSILPFPYSSTGVITIVSSTSTNSKGWKMQYAKVCERTLFNATGSIQSKFDRDAKECIYHIEQPPGFIIELSVSVRIFMIRFRRYDYCSSNVEVRDGDNENAPLIAKLCGTDSKIFNSTYNHLWIRYRPASLFSFSATYTSMDIGCGAVLRKNVGDISSPRLPEKFLSRKCSWVIFAPPKYIIELTWVLFNLHQNQQNCSDHYVEIFDNSTDLGTGGTMGKYCGTKAPPVSISTSNILTVNFVANAMYKYEFYATYKFVPRSSVCWGNYLTSTGTVVSPGYPKGYSSNRLCTWTIMVPYGQQIVLDIIDFQLEKSENCTSDSVLIRNGATSTSPLIGRFCGEKIPGQIISHTNQLYLQFTTDQQHSDFRGFQFGWTATVTGCGGTLTSPIGVLMSPLYPEPYGAYTDCMWYIIVAKGSRIKVTLEDIDLPTDTPCNRKDAADYIELFDGLSIHSNSLGVFCSNQNNSIVSDGHQMLVKFRSGTVSERRGFHLEYVTVCYNTLTGFGGVIESPNIVNGFYNGGNCKWYIIVPTGNRINITFLQFEFDTQETGSAYKGYLEINSNTQYPHNQTHAHYDFNNSDSATHVTVNSHAHVLLVDPDMGLKFVLEWQLYGCGGHLVRNSGTIQSPNYPLPYPESITCQWLIEVDLGYSVKLQINDLILEGAFYRSDWLKIYNGADNSSHLISQIFEQKNKSVVFSSGNQMFLEFFCDKLISGRGFTANYSAVPMRCGGTLTTREGNIFSPNYPNHFDANETCEWFIKMDGNNQIQLKFTFVELPPDCNNYYIEVYESFIQKKYTLLKKICNATALNDTTFHSSNEMSVVFKTGYMQDTTKGFFAKYKQSCGSRITTSGTGDVGTTLAEAFLSEECLYTIVSSDPTRHITLTITHLQTNGKEFDSDCNIKIFGGETIKSPLLKSHCGVKVPPPIVSEGSAITILVSGQTNFRAKYSVLDSHCGGDFNTLHGSFATPGYPTKYPSNIQCEWTIRVAQGMTMDLHVKEFNIPESEKCNTDFIEIRLSNSSGPLLGVYCGNNKPSNLTQVGTLWIMFQSSTLKIGEVVESTGFYGEYELNTHSELSESHGLIASPLYPDVFHESANYMWTITVDFGNRILLKFKELDIGYYIFEKCKWEKIMIFDGANSEAPLLKRICEIIPLSESITSSSNVMYIHFQSFMFASSTKFVMEWQKISEKPSPEDDIVRKDCGSSEVIDVSTVRWYNFSSPNYPNGYSDNLHCHWIFTASPVNHLVVKFWDMEFKPYEYGMCEYGDYIRFSVKPFGGGDWQSVKTVCWKREVEEELQFTNVLKVDFFSRENFTNPGFVARVWERCGSSLKGPTGYIFLNKTIVQNNGCQWNVSVRSGRTIKVTFEDLNIPKSPNQVCDGYLLLRNGEFSDSPILGKYCGTDIPTPLNTISNHLYVTYVPTAGAKGFKLKYQEVSVECNTEIVLSSSENYTEISSPNYPKIPLPHTECSWLIRAPPGESLMIDFKDELHLTPAIGCDIEYVEVRDGGSKSSPLIGRYCNSTPSAQFSKDNMMFVKFFTDTDIPKAGFKATISVTYCGGTIRGKEGRIVSPSRFVKGQKRSCTWYIVGIPIYFLNIRFTELKLHDKQSSKITVLDVNDLPEEVDNKVSELAEYTGPRSELPSPLRTSGNKAMIKYMGTTEDKFTLSFNSSYSECLDYMDADSGFITLPGYPAPRTAPIFCYWLVTVTKGQRIVLDFVDLELDDQESIDIYDGIRYANFLGTLSGRRDRWRRHFESSMNKMFLTFSSDHPSMSRGFNASYTSEESTICSGEFGEDSGNLTQPLVRNTSYWCQWHRYRQYPLNRTFTLTINAETNMLSWDDYPRNCQFAIWSILLNGLDDALELCGPSIKNYTVRLPPTEIELFVRTSTATQVNVTVSHDTYRCSGTFYELRNIVSNLDYLERLSSFPKCAWLRNVDKEKISNITMVRAPKTVEANFTIMYNTYNCGGEVNEQQGFLSSPNYPNSPSQSVECAWLVEVDEEQTINVTIINMDLGDDCDTSFLIVYNGKGLAQPTIGKYCKTDKPSFIVSQSNSLLIEYKFKDGSNGSGFKLQYEARSDSCGGVFHDRDRIIQTPNYNKNYPNNTECLWEMRSDPGYAIQVHFIGRFHIEESTNCDNDYLEVLDWQNDTWISIHKLCGRTTPTNIRSTGDKLQLLFRSNDNGITASGFKAEWIWVCGGTFKASTTPQTIISPGYFTSQQETDTNLTCTYQIISNGMITVKFEDFDLDYRNTGCDFNNVTVIYEYNQQQVFCGRIRPPSVIKSDVVEITLRMDLSVSVRGMKFTYSDQTCGGDINQTTIIKLPVIEKQIYFPHRVNCVWKVNAPPRQVPIFRVLSMQLSSTCYGQWVEVFNGLTNDRENKLATLCGNLTHDIIIHGNSSNMLVRFDSSSMQYDRFEALIYFSPGPADGCGGFVNLTDTKYIQAPDSASIVDCTWLIEAPRDYQVRVIVTALNLPERCGGMNGSKCTFLEIRDGAGPLSELVDRLQGRVDANLELPFTMSSNLGYIRLVLQRHYQSAFRATLKLVPSICGTSVLNATNEIKTLTSPNYPNKYPSDVKCTWFIFTDNESDFIDLHLIDLDIPKGNATNKCDDDRLEITEDSKRQVARTGFGPKAQIFSGNNVYYVDGDKTIYGQSLFCGNDASPFDYQSQKNSVLVTFRSRFSAKQGRGFKIEYNKIGCNRSYTDLYGQFSGRKNNCVMTIKVPENFTISLYFQELYLFQSENCSHTYFMVRDGGPNGTVLLRYCRYVRPDPIFSFTNTLYIHIYEQEENSGSFISYDVGYTSTDKGRGCGGVSYNYNGLVSSPLYPNEFRNDTICKWVIRVPVGLFVALKFQDFDIQLDCEYVSLAVTSFLKGEYRRQEFCKGDNPAIIRSETEINIEYKSSIHNGGKGWMAVFKAIDNENLEIQ